MVTHIDRDQAQADMDDLRREESAQRRYQRQLAQHPDPRDPDHPEPPVCISCGGECEQDGTLPCGH